MLTRVGVLLVAVACFAGLMGCVSADAYRAKEWEVQSLFKITEDMKEHNKSLSAEKTELENRAGAMKKDNEGLKDRIEKQNEEIAHLKNRAEELKNEGEGLRERAEKLNVKIADLNKENQRLAALTRPENLLRTLGERLADLQKQVEALAGENEKLKHKPVIARSEEEKTGGAAGEKTVAPAGEKPQAVLVSAGQKAEDSKRDQQPQEKPSKP